MLVGDRFAVFGGGDSGEEVVGGGARGPYLAVQTYRGEFDSGYAAPSSAPNGGRVRLAPVAIQRRRSDRVDGRDQFRRKGVDRHTMARGVALRRDVRQGAITLASVAASGREPQGDCPMCVRLSGVS